MSGGVESWYKCAGMAGVNGVLGYDIESRASRRPSTFRLLVRDP
jgi:hypothetical protein